MKTIFLLLCAAVTLVRQVDSANIGLPTTGSIDDVAGTPSPLDLLYQAADDDLNSISFDKSPSPQDGFQNGHDETTTQTGVPSTSSVEPQPSTELPLTTKRDSTTNDPSSAVPTLESSTSSPSTIATISSTETPSIASSTASPISSTRLSERIFPSIKASTQRPQEPTNDDDEDTEPVVDIKKKPQNPKRRKPVTPSLWDAEDEKIEKDIITKIFHGAIRNHERIRNRNLRRLLRRFQVLAFRADVSADEFHKFMRLVSEYTPSRIPAFLLRKSERRQFHETNRVRWQHIRDEMMRQAGATSRTEAVERFLRMVERDGALRSRFGKPRRSHMNVEEFLRRQAPLMRRLLLPPHIEEHPLIRELLGGRRAPSPFFVGCCDF